MFHGDLDGWEVLPINLNLDFLPETLDDVEIMLGDGTGTPRTSHYFNGPLNPNKKYMYATYLI